mgnify:CR=1 FL=1
MDKTHSRDREIAAAVADIRAIEQRDAIGPVMDHLTGRGGFAIADQIDSTQFNRIGA